MFDLDYFPENESLSCTYRVSCLNIPENSDSIRDWRLEKLVCADQSVALLLHSGSLCVGLGVLLCRYS